jgi:hypothetical protein
VSGIGENDQHLKFVDIETATTPRDGQVYVDYWWSVHPDRGLIFYDGTPQANPDRRITDMLQPRYYPWAEVRQVPVVYVGHDRALVRS